jgi:hypothetical protein
MQAEGLAQRVRESGAGSHSALVLRPEGGVRRGLPGKDGWDVFRRLLSLLQPIGAVMAERPERPAVPAAGWRSRSGVVRVAAVLLGLFGLLLVLIEADQGELGVAVVVTGLVLLFAAAALVWAGRLAADTRRSAVTIALLLVFAPGALRDLPLPMLAAIVITAAIGLIDVCAVRCLYRVRRCPE